MWSRWTVRDTGAGISPDVLARLFQPFEQGPESNARTRGGVGLGLALAKGLVELHGGEVRASSPGPGLGTEIAIVFPWQQPLAINRCLDIRSSANTEGRRCW